MLYSIHFLRLIAATAVVVEHSDLLVPWNIHTGTAGVDIFFVISGVVIGLSTDPEMSIRDFLLRRFIRIFPLYWIATLVWAAYSARFAIAPSVEHIVRSLLLFPDLSVVWFPVYLPAWTLVFELFFYAVFAACMLSRRFARPLCCVVLMLVAFKFSELGNPNIYFGFATVLLEFVAGVLISIAVERGWVPARALGGLLIAAALAWFAVGTLHDTTRVIQWGIPAVTLVFGLIAFENARFFRSKPALLGGNASYAIYLFHLSLIQAVSLIFKVNDFPVQEHRLIFAAITIPASLALGALMYLAVDKPLLRWLRRMLLPRVADRHLPAAAHSA